MQTETDTVLFGVCTIHCRALYFGDGGNRIVVLIEDQFLISPINFANETGIISAFLEIGVVSVIRADIALPDVKVAGKSQLV